MNQHSIEFFLNYSREVVENNRWMADEFELADREGALYEDESHKAGDTVERFTSPKQALEYVDQDFRKLLYIRETVCKQVMDAKKIAECLYLAARNVMGCVDIDGRLTRASRIKNRRELIVIQYVKEMRKMISDTIGWYPVETIDED